MSLLNIGRGDNLPESFQVVIEISAGAGPVKYEVDEKTGALAVDRFMGTAMSYPANYGYIPQTLCDDGDPLDVLVLTPFPLVAGCVVECRPLGILNMTDEKGGDAKLLAVPTKKICPVYDQVEQLEDVPDITRQQIQHFFEQYKALETGKWVKVDGWQDLATAKQAILDSVALYENK